MTKDELDFSGDSGSEQKKNANNDRTVINSYKRRRHDMSACLLCSLKTNVFDTQNVGRSRKTSTSSVHRTRTGIYCIIKNVIHCVFCIYLFSKYTYMFCRN